VISDDLLVEDKYTDAASFRLSVAALEKIEREALAGERIPVFRVDFAGHGRTAVVLRETDFRWLLAAAIGESDES
jgi:hypothetical protein